MVHELLFLLQQLFGFAVAHAQTVSTTWSSASTSALAANAESNGSANAYNMILYIIPITLGLAAFFFALRWIWHRISGRH